MKRIMAVTLAALLLGIPSLPAGAALDSSSTQEAVEGWHLIESLYLVPDVDVDVNNGPVESMMMGVADGQLLDYYQDSGMVGDILLTHYRTGKAGNVFASTKWEVLWDAPPSYLPAGQSASITLEHRVLEEKAWGPPRMTAAFDVQDMLIGYRSASPNVFHHPGESHSQYRDTTTEVYDALEVMTTERPIAVGEDGDRLALYIDFGEGYGMRYTYQWGTQAVTSAPTSDDGAQGGNGE